LGTRDARYRRQCGASSSQMQELTTRNLHEHLSEKTNRLPALPLRGAAIANVPAALKRKLIEPALLLIGIRRLEAAKVGMAALSPP
jgi:hypothetical protein